MVYQNPIHVFLSYAHEDEALLKELMKHLSLLKRQRLIASWYDRQIVPGTNWAEAIDERLEQSSIILLLVSPDFLASDYCYQVEMQRALERHQARRAQVIPIVMRPVDWKGAPFAHLQALPTDAKAITSWSNRDEGFADVVAGIRRAIEDLSLPLLPTNLVSKDWPGIWNIPYHRNLFFTGRNDFLAHLHNALTPGTAIALTQPRAISGLGGIGKTQTANEYAHRYAHEYAAVLWIRAETREQLSSDYSQVATLLGLVVSKERDNPNAHVEAVKLWLSKQSNWLLIFDNVEDLHLVQEFTPTRHQGHILLTTRIQITEPIALAHVLERMDETDAILFILQRAKLIIPGKSLLDVSAQERQFASKLWSEMDGLPLALDQAAAYVLETGCSLSHYLDLFKNRKAELLTLRGQFHLDHPESVMTTFSLLFEKITMMNPLAADLLRLCTFLNSDDISVEIITQVFKDQDSLALDRARRELMNHSLLLRDQRLKRLMIHRLVQVILRASMDENSFTHWARRSRQAVVTVYVAPIVDRSGYRWPPPPNDAYEAELSRIQDHYLVPDHPFPGHRFGI